MDFDFQSMRETATAALTTFGPVPEEHMHMRQVAVAQR